MPVKLIEVKWIELASITQSTMLDYTDQYSSPLLFRSTPCSVYSLHSPWSWFSSTHTQLVDQTPTPSPYCNGFHWSLRENQTTHQLGRFISKFCQSNSYTYMARHIHKGRAKLQRHIHKVPCFCKGIVEITDDNLCVATLLPLLWSTRPVWVGLRHFFSFILAALYFLTTCQAPWSYISSTPNLIPFHDLLHLVFPLLGTILLQFSYERC